MSQEYTEAESQEYLVIKAARENNLKNVSIKIQKRKITIFTGVSGSGKSSLVFDTIATEAQRLLLENFSAFVRGFLPKYPQPAADAIENLNMAVVVDQRRLGGGSHSTVGTITDLAPLLRLLFARVGEPRIGGRNLFSFNDPAGMCPDCSGMGRKLTVKLELFLDMEKSLNEGAVLFGEWAPGSWGHNLLGETGLFDMDKKLKDYSKEELKELLYGEEKKIKVNFGGKSMNITYEGLIERFTNKYIRRDLKNMSERTQKQVEPFISMGTCPSCQGARLSQRSLEVKVGGKNVAELSSMELGELLEFLKGLDLPEAEPLVQALIRGIQHLCDIGLEYLSLSRETDSLSGGESVRVKMVKHLTSGLVDVLYIFDEPSVGLHPRDVHRLNELLIKLRDKGNTVLVVEHDPEVIRIADYIVDMGPKAGSGGGEIVFYGDYPDLLKAGTLTALHMRKALSLNERPRRADGFLSVKNAWINNLRGVNVDIPASVFTVITGVAGSGKSSLIHGAFVPQNPDAIVIDQSPVGANSRSNPATYTGIMDSIRKAFATANGVKPALFSFNSQGACENCQGLGVVYTDLAFLDEVKLPCEVCGGKRFKDEVLNYRLDGKSISDVLEMTVAEAFEFFTLKDVHRVLKAMMDVGLDYLTLGQPLSTLSGGECQRIKLASELHKKGSVYIMDEPTTGLHMSDIEHLIQIMEKIVEDGNTLIVIEHNLDVIRRADWIIDMGPEGGHKGGRVMFQGPPADLARQEENLTGQFLAN